MNTAKRIELIIEAVRYCQRVKQLGMPAACYSKALREPVHYLWEHRMGSKVECASLRSVASIGLSPGTGDLIYDHAIPFRFLQENLLSLAEVTAPAVEELLNRFCHAVLITKVENSRLNAAGYSRNMPKGWDQIDPFARYKAVGIELVPNSMK